MPIGCIPALPLLACVFLVLFGSRLPRSFINAIGVLGIAGAAISTLLVYANVDQLPMTWRMATWMSFPKGETHMLVYFGFYLDALSLLMCAVITGIATLIAFYSVGYMRDEAGIARYFLTMNLFVAAMLILVLADNLLLLYLGWEGVGLCSYLLIGFWTDKHGVPSSAMKAFITTRIGDVGLLIAVAIAVVFLGTLDIQEIQNASLQLGPKESILVTVLAFCLLLGAVGKSAQLPLHVWLPDAMVGPTPVSALIHAATMVTAGVYLIARMHGIFELAPLAQTTVMWIGGLTLLLGALSALAQRDLKRVLAYSTISQLGYMFLALGVGAYSAAMFHFMTHAIFKALLFLGAGAIGYALHHEYDMMKMVGLRRELPIVFWTFLVGALCLAGLPLVTSGFYSKEMILNAAFASTSGGVVPWAMGVSCAFVTALYIFRAVFITFFGNAKSLMHQRPDSKMNGVLVILAVFGLLAGFVQTPELLGGISCFGDFLTRVLPVLHLTHLSVKTEWILVSAASAASIVGIALAYVLFVRMRLHERSEVQSTAHRFLKNGFGFDVLYRAILIRPYQSLAHALRNDAVGRSLFAFCYVARAVGATLARAHDGYLSSYLRVFVAGVLVVVWIMVFK